MSTRKGLAGVAVLLLIVLAAFWLLRDVPRKEAAPPLIAIANLQPHPILDAVQQGTIDALGEKGYRDDGVAAKFVLRNAAGDMQRVASIAEELATLKPAVTIAISTPVAQAVVRQGISPVVFGAVTDPVGASVVSDLGGAPSITGTSDALPYEAQLGLIRRILPKARILGLIFNPGEAPSQYAIREITRIAPNLGFKVVEGPVASTNEVFPVAQGLASRVDLLLISTDNTAAAGIAGAVKVASETKTPLFACDSGSVERGAIAAVSPGYYQIGIETGKLAARVLSGERNIPVVLPSGGDIFLNLEAARRMSVEIPESVRTEATKTYEEISG